MIPPEGRHLRHASGQVMMEMVLALLIVVPVLALLFFFGRGMVRAQRARMIDRYDAWREVAHARFVEPHDVSDIGAKVGVPLGPHPDAESGHAGLNQTFWGDKAASISLSNADAFPNGAGEDFIAQAQDRGEGAQAMAEGLVDSLAAGHVSRFTTAHEETVPLWRRLDGDITHRHGRIEHAWAFANGWRVLWLKRDTVAGWGYAAMEVGNHAKLQDGDPDNDDQDDQLVLRLVPQVPGPPELNLRAGGSRGTLLPSDEGYFVWQRRGPGAGPQESVRSGFLGALDEPLSAMEGNPIAHGIREIYLMQPSYVGPVLGF